MKIHTPNGGWFDDEKGALNAIHAKRRYHETELKIGRLKRTLIGNGCENDKRIEEQIHRLEGQLIVIQSAAIETSNAENRSKARS